MTDASESIDLDKIRVLAEAASPGPWSWIFHPTGDGDSWAVFDEKGHALATNDDGWVPDAAFIAEADPETVLDLIERVESAERRIAEALAIEAWPYKPDTMHGFELNEAEGYNDARKEFRRALTEGEKQ